MTIALYYGDGNSLQPSLTQSSRNRIPWPWGCCGGTRPCGGKKESKKRLGLGPAGKSSEFTDVSDAVEDTMYGIVIRCICDGFPNHSRHGHLCHSCPSDIVILWSWTGSAFNYFRDGKPIELNQETIRAVVSFPPLLYAPNPSTALEFGHILATSLSNEPPPPPPWV